MPHLIPFLPMLEHESTMSFVARLARLHTGRGPFDFLNMVQIGRKDVIEATPHALERLADLTGVSRPVIEGGSYIKVRKRFFQHRGHKFHAQFAGRLRTTYCPACLLEDRAYCSPSGGNRIGRVNWLFTPVRTCSHHRLALVRRKNRTDAERYQDMYLVAPDDDQLEAEAAQLAGRAVSPLQTYVEARLGGAAGGPWLDGQLVDLGARASQMLGACLLYGAHADLTGLGEDQWDAAGAAGYVYTSLGVDGIGQALEKLLFAARSSKGGPQAAFGRLYQWLQFSKNEKDPGPIREAVREYILANMVIEPGTRLFGEHVLHRHRHSAVTLAKQTGLHATTLNRALIQAGLLTPAPDGRADSFASVGATAGEALAEGIRSSIPIAKIPAYLNCNRPQAEMLVKRGILRRVAPEKGPTASVLNYVAIEELDSFLNRLRARGRAAERPSPGMLTMIEASERAKWPTIDIVHLVLDGYLTHVEILPANLGFKSVLVNVEEIKRQLCRSSSETPYLSVAETAARLGLRRTAVRHLISHGDSFERRAFLTAASFTNAKGASRIRIAVEEVNRFAAAHVKLGELAGERGVWDRVLRTQLEERGVRPILPRAMLDVYVYRRIDIDETN